MSYETAWKSCMDAHRIARKLTEKRAGVSVAVSKQPFSITDLDKLMDAALMGRTTATGVNVNSDSAMTCVPYLAGVRLIAETVGQLPLIEYVRVQPRGKKRATNRILYRLLHDEPNPEMTAIAFKEAMQGHAVTWGNAFAEIQWDDNGYPVALWPMPPNRVKVGRDKLTNEIIYVLSLPDGTTAVLPYFRVWHMPGFSFDGLIGYDTVYLAREAIGMSMALEEYGARFFGNGANPGGVLEHPAKLTSEAQDRLRKSWNEMHQGLTNQHRIAILEEGMSYKQVGIPPENAQFLESQKFSITQIARLLHIPPHMLADLDRATFSNIEHQGIEFVIYTMMPWFKRWEQTCNKKLLVGDEKFIFFFEFLVDALLRGDSKARAEYYASRFANGSITANEIREAENMNPVDDPNADKLFVQANIVPMESAGKQLQLPPPSPDQSKVEDVVRKIVDRDKQNVLNGHRKNPAKFDSWADDYYREFENYMVKEIVQISNNGHTEVDNGG